MERLAHQPRELTPSEKKFETLDALGLMMGDLGTEIHETSLEIEAAADILTHAARTLEDSGSDAARFNTLADKAQALVARKKNLAAKMEQLEASAIALLKFRQVPKA